MPGQAEPPPPPAAAAVAAALTAPALKGADSTCRLLAVHLPSCSHTCKLLLLLLLLLLPPAAATPNFWTEEHPLIGIWPLKRVLRLLQDPQNGRAVYQQQQQKQQQQCSAAAAAAAAQGRIWPLGIMVTRESLE
jgi:hypothetical protein